MKNHGIFNVCMRMPNKQNSIFLFAIVISQQGIEIMRHRPTDSARCIYNYMLYMYE